jgi:regulatory protein
MMERFITAIRVQKRNPNRVNIELDGEFAFGLSRIVSAWLKIGDRLTDERIRTLLEQDASDMALQKALHLIGRRPRTESEIRQKLSEKDFSAGQIELTVNKLRKEELIQDAKFAEMWVEDRNAFHPRSKRMIAYELKRKGIAEDLIGNALRGTTDDSVLALQAANQYARRLTGLDWLTFKKKLSSFLIRRGFDYGTISPVVRKVWDQINLDGNESGKNEEF